MGVISVGTRCRPQLLILDHKSHYQTILDSEYYCRPQLLTLDQNFKYQTTTLNTIRSIIQHACLNLQTKTLNTRQKLQILDHNSEYQTTNRLGPGTRSWQWLQFEFKQSSAFYYYIFHISEKKKRAQVLKSQINAFQNYK